MSPGLKRAIIKMLSDDVRVFKDRSGAQFVELIPVPKGIQIYSDKVFGKRRTLFTDEELDSGQHKSLFNKRMQDLFGVYDVV